MKRKNLVTLLLLICTLCLSICLSACARDDDSISAHTHKYQWIDNGNGTHKQHCSVSGCDEPNINAEPHVWGVNGICEKCKVAKQNNEHTHNYALKYDETNHWQECNVVGCDEKVKDCTPHDALGTNGECSGCGYSNSLLTFKTLQLGENDTVYGKVSNSTETFSFIKEITANSATTYTVSTDIIGNQTIPTKTVPLEIGDNTFYILAQNENNAALFTVTIRRRPIYTVSYITNGGSPILSQNIEEDNAVNEQVSTKMGYTLENWTVNYSPVAFPYAITQDTEFNAVFTANDYAIILDANGGESATAVQALTFNSSYTLPVPTRLHYTFIGWYDGEVKVTDTNGDSLSVSRFVTQTILKAHWQINQHQLNITYNTAAGSVSGTEAGTFDYNTTIYVMASENNLGYKWLGWYDGDTRLTEDKNYEFSFPDKNVDLTAKWEAVPEMEPFYFNSSVDTCTIIGVKDNAISNAVVPNFVTSINQGAFRSCIGIKSITIPFVGASKDGKGATNFGYIFGASSWTYNSQYMPSLLNTVIITGGKDIGDHAFFRCSHITSITISNSVTSITNAAFAYCSGLKSITLSDSITSIEDYAFSGCTNLSNVTIPQNVASIGLRAFESCSSLMSIIIPSSVTNVGNAVFDKCSNITIYCQAQSKPSGWGENWSYGVTNIIWGYEGE